MIDEQNKENKENEEKEINKIYRTEDGIDILKNPETIEEKVLNSIFLSDKKDIEEVSQEEIDELVREYKQKLEEKEETED